MLVQELSDTLRMPAAAAAVLLQASTLLLTG
jgi:hypothetical protein